MKFLVLLFIIGVFAAEDPGVAQLTNNYIQTHFTAERMNAVNSLLQNPAMKTFYEQYYLRPQQTQQMQIANLVKRVNSKKFKTGQFPYANQVAVDPNVVHRLIATRPLANLRNRIDSKMAALGTVESNNRLQEDAYAKLYKDAHGDVAQKRDADLFKMIANTESNLHSSGVRSTPEHTYSTPFIGKNSNMDRILDSIRTMENEVRQPLSPMKPNAIEITAMNRLADKLAQISQRVHTKPLDDLHQDAHAQDVMLDRAANLIRSMSQNIESTKQNDYLNAVHQLLHKNHLHDHKFLSSLENEITHAVANSQPLNAPRVYGSFDSAFGGLTADKQRSGLLNSAAPVPVTSPSATAAPSTTADEPANARNVAASMKGYGKDMLARADELNRRADIVENRQAVPYAERQRLSRHIQNRLAAPPVQVHALGANRPLEF